MFGDFDEDEIDDDYEVMDDDDCPECAGEGVILTCIDDMCRGVSASTATAVQPARHADGVRLTGSRPPS